MRTECWLGGTCCWANSQLHLNTDQELYHNNADGMSRQCGQCRRPDCPVSAADIPMIDNDTQSLLVDQPFATSEMGDSMDADLLPEGSGETWVASALLDELTNDLPAPGVGDNLVSDTASDKVLQTVRSWWIRVLAPPWRECAGLSPELRSWRLQVGNIKIDSEGRLWRRRSPPAVGSQLVIPVVKRREFIREFHEFTVCWSHGSHADSVSSPG